MLGFTLPLMIILGAEALVGSLLLCPKPLNQPSIKLARATYTQVRGQASCGWGGVESRRGDGDGDGGCESVGR